MPSWRNSAVVLRKFGSVYIVLRLMAIPVVYLSRLMCGHEVSMFSRFLWSSITTSQRMVYLSLSSRIAKSLI